MDDTINNINCIPTQTDGVIYSSYLIRDEPVPIDTMFMNHCHEIVMNFMSEVKCVINSHILFGVCDIGVIIGFVYCVSCAQWRVLS